MQYDIYSIPLSKIQSITKEIDEALLSSVISSNPRLGKENPTHYVLNTILTNYNIPNIAGIKILFVLLQMASSKAPILLITKN